MNRFGDYGYIRALVRTELLPKSLLDSEIILNSRAARPEGLDGCWLGGKAS
jgi:hypothetical protein